MSVNKAEEQYRGQLFQITSLVKEMPNGAKRVFEWAERPPGVRVLASDAGRILLTREWRDETQSWDYRLPGGKVFDSLEDYLECSAKERGRIGDYAQAAAQREFKEETCIDKAREDFRLIYLSRCGSTVVWDLYYYVVQLGEKDSLVSMIHTHEGERIRPVFCTREEAVNFCLEGKVQEDRTAAVLLRHLLAAKP